MAPRIQNRKVFLFSGIEDLAEFNEPYLESEYVQEIVNIVLLTSGSTLNLTLLFGILFSSLTRTSVSCYVFSFICSDVILLLDVLREVLLHCCGVNFQLNLDYVSYVTFEASVLTLAMLSLDRYVLFCRSNTVWRKIIPTIATAAKSVLTIWSLATMTTAMQLHLHSRVKEETFGNIFVSATLMFTVLPTAVIVFLASLILFRRSTVEHSQRDADQAESLLLLLALTIGFLITMLPKRVAMVIQFLYPNFCCTIKIFNQYFLLSKLSAVVIPIICFATSKTLRTAIKNIFWKCKWDRIKISSYR